MFLQYEAPGYSEQGVRNFRRALRDPVYVRQLRVFAAFDGRDVAGMLATRDGGGHVALFFVGAAYQRIGVGRALFGMALRAHPEGMTVNAAPFAVGFYHRLGFADTGAETVTDGIRYTPMQYRPAAAAGGAL
ncbi:MAG: GNAT family N-acetyltransferase [Oscillospiraceae bacterium]|nr:GNAT family N-acetyltransferase [Oscillospiraceae bacterium]